MQLKSFRSFLNEQSANNNVTALVSRTDMPQFDDDLLDKAKNYFGYDLVDLSKGEVTSLRTVQHHLDLEKVNRINKFDKPIVTSSDDHIVDGNHRAAAFVLSKSAPETISAVRLNADVISILAWSKQDDQ